MYYSKYNQRGRIALMEDASGFQTFKYGRMGEVIENNHTFVLPNENHQYSFRMQYSYDSWNRVQYISYPDGEEVLYRYNTGGMLDSVYGRKSAIMRDGTGDGVDVGRIGPTNPPPTYTYHYINHTTYNEFELKSGQWYGNGTQAHYSYDTLQRLSHLTAYKSARTPMQDITYTYDKVGNITQISNAAGVVNTLGNIYSYSYTYDSLYRLTSGYGSVGSGKPLANYTLNMQYEADGRIIQKNQSGRTRLNGTVQTFNDSRLYTYNTSQPHTVQSISGTNYYWDANGNMTNDGGAILTWDEENRLKRHSKSLKKTCFFYDAAGERYYKNSGATVFVMINGIGQQMTFYENPTLYASPYVVVTPDGYTKHYFVESERFASRIGDGTIMGLNTHATTASALAAKQAKVNFYAPDSIRPDKLSNLRSLPSNWSAHHTTYWQHSDHLGSASWVTDTNGTAYQHLQYMPWGEPLLDQRKSGYTYNTRYTFSGKERDEETGYSYFGARHYHPTLSIWLSVDPMSDKYPSTSPYAYCGDNPIIFKDPNGFEKVISISTNTGNSEKDNENQRLIDAANFAHAEEPVIHIFAHGAVYKGNCWGMIVCDEAGEKTLSKPQDIQEFLQANSEVYHRNQDMGNVSILVLHSCKTGQDGSIAEKTSREFNNLLIIAPSDNVQVRVCDGTSYEYGIKNDGTWNLYYKGEKMDTFKELPIINDTDLFIRTYEEKYAKTHQATGID